MTITEEKLNDVINGAMSRLFTVRDDVHKEVEALAKKIHAGRGEVSEIQRQQTSARMELARLISEGERALAQLEKISRQVAALKPSLKEHKALMGKEVQMVGGDRRYVVGGIDDAGMVTCYTELYAADGSYEGIESFTVPYVVLKKV